MYSLPDEQNKLLKQLGEIDSQERTGLIPVRSNITLFLIFFIWTIATIDVILNLTGQRNDGLYIIIGIALTLSFLLILCYYNLKFGYYLASIAVIAISFFITRNSNFENTVLVVLIDSVALFTISNLFGKNGYITGAIIFLAKIVGIHFFIQNNSNIETLISQSVNILAIGVIPVLMLSISKVSRRAKKQEIRAEILALQNQDLVSSWGSMFDKTTATLQGSPSNVYSMPQPTSPTPPQVFSSTPTSIPTQS